MQGTLLIRLNTNYAIIAITMRSLIAITSRVVRPRIRFEDHLLPGGVVIRSLYAHMCTTGV